MQTNRCVGTVAWFDVKRGMGFISRDGGPDVFVHHSKIFSSQGERRELRSGDVVEFSIDEANGKQQAFGVQVISRIQDWRQLG